MAQRDVIVSGVTVPMYRVEESDRTRPIRIAVRLLEMDPSASFGGAPENEARAAIRALRDAGVEYLPLIEDEAREAGIEWRETT